MATFLLKIRLGISLCWFGWKFLGEYFHHVRAFVAALLLFGTMILVAVFSVFRMQQQILHEQISSVLLETTLPHKEIMLNRDQLEVRMDTLEKLREKQPEHLGILINISLLKRAIHNQKEAVIYWQEAQKIDPNNSLFSQK
ncbi:hypothetical protein KA082_01945 [Candidatus Woesebacteria bacterium]|nr:hypothetical protein [Candidatus Woesebacteria bacterium]